MLWRLSVLVTAGALMLSSGSAAAWAMSGTETAESAEAAKSHPETREATATTDQSADREDSSAEEPASESEATDAPTADQAKDGEDISSHSTQLLDGGESVSIALTQKEGTPQWDDLDDSDSNGIIRTNDLITYTVQLTANGLQEDTTVTVELPQGGILNMVPGFCNPGSSLLPAPGDIPEPEVPLTGDSWKSIPKQTLVCKLGDLAGENAGLDTKFDVTVKVRPEVPNGTELPAVASVTTTAQSEPVVSNEVSATVAAAPQYDISKNGYTELPNDGSDANNGPIGVVASPIPCSYDSTLRCQEISYPLWISVPAGGKGNSPATELSFVDDLTPEAFFGEGITEHPAWKPEYAPRLKYVNNTNPQRVGSKIGVPASNTVDNSVRDSGTWEVVNDGGLYTITLKNGDYTAWTYPNQSTQGTPMSNQQRAGVVSLRVVVELPWDAVKMLGKDAGSGITQLGTKNQYSDFKVTSVSGQENAPGAEEPRNNTRTQVLTARVGGIGWDSSKSFNRIDSTSDPVQYTTNVPGASAPRSGDGVVARGQFLQSRVSISNTIDPSHATPTLDAVVCDYWDAKQFNLAPGDWRGGGGIVSPRSSEGAAVWKLTGNEPGATLSGIQYGVLSFTPDPSIPAGVSPAIPGGCEDSRITWYDSIEAAGGADQVGAVRADVSIPRTLSRSNGLTVGIALRATDQTRAANTIMPNYSTVVALPTPVDERATRAEILESGEKRASGYIGDTHVGARGDRVLAGELYASINKQIQDPTDGRWTDDLQAFSGGQEAKFRLIPSLSSTSPMAKSKQVVLEDCIPKGFTLTDSTREYTTVRPGDASLTCATGETYVRWDIGEVSVTDSMEDLLAPIEYTVTVSQLLTPGVYENVARVLAEGDPAVSAPENYKRVTDKQQALIQSLRGVFLEKSSLTPETQINLPDQVENELTSWEVRIGNMETDGPREMDVIDRLPVQTGTTGNAFDGTMTFVGAEIVDYGSGDPDQSRSTLYYTTAASFDLDPRAASNTQGDGSVTEIWSQTPPSDPSTVTGVRLVRDGAFESGEQLAFRIDMEGVDNRGADTYRNATQAVAHQGLGGLLTASGKSRVVESTFGDYFWIDANGNGVQDSGETGVPEATVKLQGVDDLGNPVELETTTDAAGKYEFRVRSSDENGYKVSFEIPDELEGYEFTGTTVGSDSTVDSDADGNGTTASVVIGAADENLTVDAGIVKSEIDLVKSATPTSGVDTGDEVTYTFTTTNTGATVLHGVELAEQAFTNADGTPLTLDAPPVLDTDASTGTPEDLAPGEILVWTATYTIQSEDMGGLIVNDAKTTGISPRDNTVSDTDTQTVTPKGIGAYTYSKTADVVSGSEVLPGDTITYTLSIAHNGQGKVDGATVTDDLSQVLDDADYNGDVTASAGNVTIADGVLTWNGDLSDGENVTITYSVTAKSGGDEVLNNAVTTTDDRGQCEDAIGCETDHRITPGSFTFSKSSDPESGTKVSIDDTVNYTVTVKHDGAGVVTNATLADDLSDVLDDSDYQGDVEASAGKATIEGNTLTWTGDLADGAEVTITYSVKVTSGGNEILHNTVSTTDNRGECDAEHGCETVQTLGEGMFVYSKSADHKSGTTVRVGDEVTYTLTVEHRGDGTVKNATIVDDLGDVLDDADYNGDVKASSGEAKVVDGVLSWIGNIAHGDTVNITYSVTTKQGGDRNLTNGITSEDPRGVIDPNGHGETKHKLVPPGAGLALTGSEFQILWIGGAVTLLLLGGAFLLAQRRRRKCMN